MSAAMIGGKNNKKAELSDSRRNNKAGLSDCRRRFQGKTEDLAEALKIQTPADVKYGESSKVKINRKLLAQQKMRLRRLKLLQDNMSFKKKQLQKALSMEATRNDELWAFTPEQKIEFSEKVAQRLMRM